MKDLQLEVRQVMSRQFWCHACLKGSGDACPMAHLNEYAVNDTKESDHIYKVYRKGKSEENRGRSRSGNWRGKKQSGGAKPCQEW